MAPKENSFKKIYRSEFPQSSFIFVIYLLKEVYRKVMSEIHFVDKTRYEDLTEIILYSTQTALCVLCILMQLYAL